jgi:hypothetical protein
MKKITMLALAAVALSSVTAMAEIQSTTADVPVNMIVENIGSLTRTDGATTLALTITNNGKYSNISSATLTAQGNVDLMATVAATGLPLNSQLYVASSSTIDPTTINTPATDFGGTVVTISDIAGVESSDGVATKVIQYNALLNENAPEAFTIKFAAATNANNIAAVNAGGTGVVVEFTVSEDTGV